MKKIDLHMLFIALSVTVQMLELGGSRASTFADPLANCY